MRMSFSILSISLRIWSLNPRLIMWILAEPAVELCAEIAQNVIDVFHRWQGLPKFSKITLANYFNIAFVIIPLQKWKVEKCLGPT